MRIKCLGVSWGWILIALACGCATPKNFEQRKQERYGAYSGLSPELRLLVDQGKVKVGMSEDAAYIALGKPDEIIQEETQAGATTHWLYHASSMQEHQYWTYRGYRAGRRFYSEPYMARDYYLRPYVRMEVVFQNGVVNQWRTLPSPK
ncbi:MAG: hypothetical protein HYR88_00200 [Verrucomicrobia bacterium]|nr:hypothetical protein [Verrucomicrobiota bacterium]MBI3870179.1 hypothetical protein [Verrucomicrobiota bacterium]